MISQMEILPRYAAPIGEFAAPLSIDRIIRIAPVVTQAFRLILYLDDPVHGWTPGYPILPKPGEILPHLEETYVHKPGPAC